MKHHHNIFNHAAALMAMLFIVLATGCSITKKLPEGETLYVGLGPIRYDTPGVEIPDGLKSQVKDALDAPTNKKSLMFVPSALLAYNYADTTNWIGRWFYRRFAQEPITVSDVRAPARITAVEKLLDNNGYFHNSMRYYSIPQYLKRKAKLGYHIATGEPFLLDTIYLLPDTLPLTALIDSLARRESYLKPGNRYCTDSLSVVRTRITNSLRNRGYYFFKPEFIEYFADTFAVRNHVQLKLDLANNIPEVALKPYYTGRVTVYTFRNGGGGTPDTIEMPRVTLIRMNPQRLRNNAINSAVTFRQGRLFSVRDMNRTQSYLARLGIFNSIDISVRPDTTATRPTLDVAVSCTFDAPLEATIEANVSMKSNSYLGPGITLGLNNRNMFGGGELLSLKLRGSYEWQTGKGASRVFNSYEFGITGSLSFPRLLAPSFVPRRRHASNWTRITLNADLLNRPHYFKMAQFNTSYSYDWMTSRYATNSMTPFKLTYTNLINTTAAFDSITAENPTIALSFRSQFIPQMSYTYNYNRDLDSNNSLNFYVSVQEAGNLFWAIWEACGVKGEKTLFGTPFSQFVKGTAQVVYGRRLEGQKWLWTRVAVGAAHAYGNASEVPYIEQFYCGGPNSVRGFPIRSLGPGSYRPPVNNVNGYFDQTGTFKFEFNVEYRFPMFGPLHGAVFFDAGNVWLLKSDPARPGGKLEGANFLRDLATGTGAGLRVDIGMMVIRADLGIALHAPYATKKHGYLNIPSFEDAFALHFAVGYPF